MATKQDRRAGDAAALKDLPPKTTQATLVRYDAACRAIAAARSVDEAKEIRNQAVAMAAYARQAKNRDLEADAVEIRMRATRRLDQMRQAQKETVGLNRGLAGSEITGFSKNPVKDSRPTLASQGIDKNLAHHARVLGALSDQKFEAAVADARDAATRTMRRIINTAEIEQERERHRARVQHGGTVADLHALVESGYRANVIVPDPPWPFDVYSKQGQQRSPARHYETMTLDAIKALPVAALAAENCALLLWGVWPQLPGVLDVIQAWGFEYKTCAFVWVKLNPDGSPFTGMGFDTRANTEFVLLAKRGSPLRLATDVHQVILAPVGAHSEKPEEFFRRIERLYGGPYLELFARRPREGWTTWGNEVASPVHADTTAPAATASAADLEDGIPLFLDRRSAS
jgi:N6-adenosine-specific RNA methylase IME4